MRVHASIIAVTGVLFLITITTGFVQSRNLQQYDPRLSGRPLADAIFNIHKFAALAALVTAIVTIRRLHRGVTFTGLEWTAAIFAGGFFLLMLITGGLLSLGRPRNEALLVIHQVFSVLTAIPTFGAIYLMTRDKW